MPLVLSSPVQSECRCYQTASTRTSRQHPERILTRCPFVPLFILKTIVFIKTGSGPQRNLTKKAVFSQRLAFNLARRGFNTVIFGACLDGVFSAQCTVNTLAVLDALGRYGVFGARKRFFSAM